MDFLSKTLDILENIMGIVAELDPGQKPIISEDLGDLRLMKQQLKKACDGECQKESSVLNLCSVSFSEAELCGKPNCNRPKLDSSPLCSYHFDIANS